MILRKCLLLIRVKQTTVSKKHLHTGNLRIHLRWFTRESFSTLVVSETLLKLYK